MKEKLKLDKAYVGAISIARNFEDKTREKGITLVALIITIIVLIILAAVSVKIVFDRGIINLAVAGTENYAGEQRKEEEMFNNTLEFVTAAINKKPHIEVLKCSDRTASTMKITAMAIDEDREKLTYKLYMGTDKENLEEQTEVQENKETGTEVIWEVEVIDNTTTYYYKIIVKDKYSEVDSGIRKTNIAPVIGETTIDMDFDETIGNWLKVTTSATDTENDKLIYTLKMWKKEEDANEEDVINGTPTIMKPKENVTAGETVEIQIDNLEEYTDYIYRIDVADENNIIIGTKGNLKTYCSGKTQICSGAETCSVCNGTKMHTNVTVQEIGQGKAYWERNLGELCTLSYS